jgi:hypothetical protein
VDCPTPERWGDPRYISCYRNPFNGQLFWLFAGHEQRAGDPPVGDPNQGLLQFGFYDMSQEHLLYMDLLKTPQIAGPVTIASVEGGIVTLVAADHVPPVTFVFDLAARQWVSLPISSPAPSP